jgi:hypothetical protein
MIPINDVNGIIDETIYQYITNNIFIFFCLYKKIINEIILDLVLLLIQRVGTKL